MALDRQLPISTTPGAITGNSYMDAVQEEVTGLWDRSTCQLTSVAGTNTITANCDVPLTGTYVDGMNFILVPAVTNTSTTVTLNIQSLGAKTIVDNLGNAPRVGGLVAGAKYLLEYDSAAGGKFYLLSFIPPDAFTDRPSFRNVLVNGGALVWQRGSSISVAASTTAYTVDRWYLTTNANQASTVARGSFSDRSQFCTVVTRNNGQTGTGTYVFAYPLTTDEVARLRGSKCTLSMRLGIGGGFSPASGTVNYAFYVGTGAEGKRGAGFTSETTVISGSVNLSTTTSVNATSAAAVPTTATQGEVRFTWTPVGTAGANDTLIVDSVQLESGVTVTEFEYLPFEYCLNSCQRHYTKTFPYATVPAQNAGLAGSLSSGGPDLADIAAGLNVSIPGNYTAASFGVCIHWRFPQQMRATPTITTYNPSAANANIRLPTGGGGGAIDSTVTVSPDTSTSADGVTMVGVGVAAAAITVTKNRVGYLHAQADASL